MLDPAKKKLSIIFLSTMIGMIFAILTTVYFFMDYRLTNSVRDHLIESIETEFMPHYSKDDFEVLSKIVEDELFQVLDRNGDIIISVQSSIGFSPTLNRHHLDAALKGRQVFDVTTHNNEGYIISYYPLDGNQVGRAVHPLETRTVFRENFLTFTVFALPLMLFLAYVSSRYMVSQALKPISNVMKYQENFSSNVSHELKSPMTSIKGSLEVALRRERSPQEYRGILKSVLQKIGDVIDLLNNLSLMSSSNFKPLDLYRENVNMSDVIDAVIDKYEPIIYSKNLVLNIPVHEKTSHHQAVVCECDSGLIRRAIENLFDNALKYTPPGGSIELCYGNDSNHFVFAIANTSPDIDVDELKSFFEPFYRGKNVREKNIDGRGIGLHVVQHIVYSHGGTFSSRFDDGFISFTLRIPNTGQHNSFQRASSPATR